MQCLPDLKLRIRPTNTQPEDSLLSAMERAGSEDIGDDVERKGLGTSATRADVIEKLVKNGYVKRVKKQMIPTENGLKDGMKIKGTQYKGKLEFPKKNEEE